MDDLTDQLRALGQATEAAVSPTQASDVRSSTNEIGLSATGEAASPLLHRPASRRNRLLLAAAASLAIAALGAAFLLRADQDPPASLETASQAGGAAQEFVVPDEDNGWSGLRFCESTGDYSADSGNTFYGAYQFTREAFRMTAEPLGFNEYASTNPADAAPEIQDAIANALYLERGSDPWPVCKRFIEGPMITPVVPQWMGGFGRSAFEVIIFIDPSVDDDRLDEIAQEIDEIVGRPAAESISYVSKEDAYIEFQTMFTDNDEIADSVQVSDMPPSFRVAASVPGQARRQKLRDIPGVFEVVEADTTSILGPPPPMNLRIDSISLTTPVFAAATLDNLGRGPAVLGANGADPAIAGYGSVAGSVFADLDQLDQGDLVQITSLQLGPLEDPVPTEVRRTYEVTAVFLVPLDELPTAAETTLEGAVLVADVPDDPTLRTVVWTRQIAPETSEYGIASTN